ncbi:MAG: acyltransferase domain-containing protein, partial [Cyanobacteria bacterium J06636_16]
KAFEHHNTNTVTKYSTLGICIKSLSDALTDGDTIYAVIKGSAVNNDGAEKVSLTAPSVTGQAAVIAAALKNARVDPATISYIEAHGTGTALGDPIEVAALNKVFGQTAAERSDRCAIGSVKTNIGHLDAAAGIAGLIKTVLALKHQQIPPSLNFQQPNPQIDFANSPFTVQSQLSDWPCNGMPRRAGVSSFGMGGTNVHVVLEEASNNSKFKIQNSKFDSSLPQSLDQEPNADEPSRLLVLSAKTSSALQQMTAHLANHLKTHLELDLADVAYTLQIGRRAFAHRWVCVCQTHVDAVQKLTSNELPNQIVDAAPRTVAFMFSGQGSQYPDMGRGLYEQEPVFRQALDRCAAILAVEGVDLLELLYGKAKDESNAEGRRQKAEETRSREQGTGNREQGAKNEERRTKNKLKTQNSKLKTLLPNSEFRMHQTQFAQPTLFALEYALAQLWLSYGIEPQALMGHSIGEYVAACLAGVFSLEDGLRLVAARGRLMQACPAGAMLSVALSEGALATLLPGDMVIAVVNGPEVCAVSGTEAAIARCQSLLESKDISCRRLQVSHGFHSPLMEPAVVELEALVQQVTLRAPQIDLLSNVTGTWLTADEATNPAYWAQHLRQPVRFYNGVLELLQLPQPLLLEVGPGRTLTTLAQRTATAMEFNVTVLNSLPHPKEKTTDGAVILGSLGRLWSAGVEVQWANYYDQRKSYAKAPEQRRRVPLPTYPFERDRYWVALNAGIEPSKPLQNTKAADLADWFYLPSWLRSPVSIAPPLVSDGQASAATPQRWLVFAAEATGSALAKRLAETDQAVIRVQPGAEFSPKEDGFTLNPANPEDYRLLIQALQAAEQLPTHILHGWSLADSSLDLGFYSVLYLTQALGPAVTISEETQPLSFNVVTMNGQAVVGTEAIDPLSAMVAGLCKVIPQEDPQIRCRHLDVSVPTVSTPAFASLVDTLHRELAATDPIVVYREGYRWVQSYELLPLPEVQPPLRRQGTYLIAADLVEGLGMVYAQALRQEVQAKLVLISRLGLPVSDEWERWLATHGPQHEVSRLIRKLQSLGTAGTDYLWFSVDLADEAAVRAAVAQGQAQFGNCHGVIHAGTMGDRASCFIPELTWEECDRQFHSKLQGMHVLTSALADQEPDFYLLQSSLSAVVGGMGFGAYAAANTYLDGLAAVHRRDAKTRWISLNWDACRLDDAPQDTGSALLDLAMTPEEVWQATKRVLAQPHLSQVAISPSDLRARINQWIYHPETLQTQPRIDAPESHMRPHVSSEYVPPRNATEVAVAAAMQELLGIEKIGIHDNFFELGGHSLLAIQAVTRLRKEFRVELPMRAFLFEAPTVAGIAKIIEENQPTNADQAALETMLNQIESMPLEEVKNQLSNQPRTQTL